MLPLYCAKAARLESSKKRGPRKNRRHDGSIVLLPTGVNDFSRMRTAYIALLKPLSRIFCSSTAFVSATGNRTRPPPGNSTAVEKLRAGVSSAKGEVA